MNSVGENYRLLLKRIEKAALGVGRDPGAVRLIGVSKRVEVERIREAIKYGLTDIGENRVQEAEQKIPQLDEALDGGKVQCHLIGHLQANKAAKALGLFSWIQSVDSRALAQRLDRLTTGRLRVLIQVKLEEEPSKAGVARSDLPQLIDVIHASEKLDLKGLMAIPPFLEDPEDVRPYFRELRQTGQEFSLPELSMGMSHDFEVAIEEGATMVRVGTALFGERE